MHMSDLCIVQYDDRDDLGDDLKKLTDHNKKVCDTMKNCTYMYSNDNMNLPPYWAKVKAVDNALSTNCKNVFWVDTDAAIRTFNSEELVNLLSEKSMVLSGDMPPWKSGKFNAGVWGVKNDDTGKRIIKDWMNTYDSKSWIQNPDKKWYCISDNQFCEWGGPKYEQGSFVEHIQSRYADDINTVKFTVLNNPKCKKNGETLVSHFAGHYKNRLNSCKL